MKAASALRKDSAAYRTLAAWIRAGMIYRGEKEPTLARLEITPQARTYTRGDDQQLQVQAHYSDGSVRDVTALASFASNDKEIARVTEERADQRRASPADRP